jgi:hypothetical protein
MTINKKDCKVRVVLNNDLEFFGFVNIVGYNRLSDFLNKNNDTFLRLYINDNVTLINKRHILFVKED